MSFWRRRQSWIIGGIVLLAALFVLTLALPVPVWRTGREPVAPLDLAPGELPAGAKARVWIDTDAACGASSRTDPDDCLALALLLRSGEVHAVGISTVFGNAALETTDRTTRQLVGLFGSKVPVYAGARDAAERHSEASDALRQALREGPLTIVALGPLTNVAAALDGKRGLQARVVALIAVMGHREGHLFHPTEGASGAMWLGHGPIFRDFNFAKDEDAATAIVGMHLPLALVPYDASRELPMTQGDLDALAAAGDPLKWVADRSRSWLAYWKTDIGQPGFYAFDLAAAGYLAHPDAFECAHVSARVVRTRGPARLFTATALIVGAEAIDSEGDDEGEATTLTYCPKADVGLKQRLISAMTTAR